MADANINSTVDLLRERTQKAGLDQYLKSGIYGYTKKSVIDFLTFLRKQQQSMMDTFSQNLQSLFEEKENLQIENDKLRSKLKRIDAEYKDLSDAVTTYNIGNQEYTLQDIFTLKGSVASLESENKKLDNINHELEKKIERLNITVNDKEKSLEKSKQDIQLQNELYMAEKNESGKQHGLISELTDNVEELRDELRYYKGIVTEGKIAELNAEIDELMINVSSQADIIARIKQELSGKQNMAESLMEENSTLRQNIDIFENSLDSLMIQNEKLVFSNKEFALKLEEMNRYIISLINEKSDISVENLIICRKLDEANRNISMLKMEKGKIKKDEEIDAITALL